MNKIAMKSLLLAAGIACAASVAQAADTGRGIYVGAFGGLGRTDNQDVQQTGVAHKRGDYALAGFSDFDLKVDVKGSVKRNTSTLAGAHVGYEWAVPASKFKAAIELEGLYLDADQKSNLENPLTEVVANTDVEAESYSHLLEAVNEHYGAGEHRFKNSLNMNATLFLANGVATYDTGTQFEPYIGAGVGIALVNMKDAVSNQTNPSGPIELTSDTHEEVNHFNSKTHASDYAFAAQMKVGVRTKLTDRISAFAEYRYVHVNATQFTFGSTSYVGHSPTDNWNVNNGAMNLHNGVIGVEYAF